MADHDMVMDDGDDLYEPEDPKIEPAPAPKSKDAPSKEDLEEGEEEDEGGAMDEDDDDSDIDIITERKDGTKAAPPTWVSQNKRRGGRPRELTAQVTRQSKYSEIRNIPQRSTSTDVATKPAPTKKSSEARAAASAATPSADQASAAASRSTMDINSNPIYPAAGKPITQVNIDQDLADKEKPWRKPGTDISDYFNYGFDEFTWALYASKQESIRGEYGSDAFAANNKKMMDDFNMMMMGGMGMPSNAGGGGTGGGGGPMPGLDGVPSEMQAMMQQMMASGMDPTQMDPSQMAAMFAGMQGGGAQGAQGQGFGGNFAGVQGGFGYDQSMGGAAGTGAGGGGRGGFGGGGGGRGRRGRW